MQCHLYFIYNTYTDEKVIQVLKNIKIMDFKTKTLSLYKSDYKKNYTLLNQFSTFYSENLCFYQNI